MASSNFQSYYIFISALINLCGNKYYYIMLLKDHVIKRIVFLFNYKANVYYYSNASSFIVFYTIRDI